MSDHALEPAAAAELLRALGVLSEGARPQHDAASRALGLGAVPTSAEYTQILGLQVMPYAAIHLGPEGMLGGEAADRIGGFWRAVGYRPPAEPDHLAALLGLYAALIEAEAGESEPARAVLRRQARSALLWEHLLSWVPAFGQAVSDAGSDYYAGWAGLLAEVLLDQARQLPAPDQLSRHLAEAPGLSDDATSPREFAQALLTPVRSGLVLTRTDLARAAHATNLALRVGERAFTLAAMLEQDPVVTLQWVAGEADRWADLHQQHADVLGGVAEFWTARARSTAAACRAGQTTLQEVLADVG